MFYKTFKVALLSSNTNSFGLQHAVLVAEDGTAFQAHPSKYGSDPLNQGDERRVKCADTGRPLLDTTGWEMCSHLPAAPPEVVATVWGKTADRSDVDSGNDESAFGDHANIDNENA